MPATSSAPGSQPEAVAKKNAKAQTKQVVKTVAKSTAKAVTAGAGTAVVAAPVASSTASAPSRRSSRNSGRRSRPEPLQYKPPKPVAVKVKEDLKTLGSPKALKAIKRPIYVAPHLQTSVHLTKHRTLIAPSVEQSVTKRLDRIQKAQKPQVPQKPKAPPKPVRKAVKRKLAEAAKKAKPKLDTSSIPDMGNSREVAPIVKRMAEKRGMKPSVLMAQIEQESGFNPLATEQGGSVSNTPSESQGGGETQFIPSTAAAYGVKYGDSPKAVRSQLKGQAKYMAALGGTTAEALGAYYGDHDPNGAYAQGILANSSKYAALDAPAGKGKPIPQNLKDRAKQVLGEPKTKKVIASAQAPTSTQPKQLPGRYSGSKTVVQKLVGSKVRGDHGGTKFGEAPGVHSAEGDHYDPNSYAQDINGSNPREHEPAYNQATLTKIVRNARKFGFKDVPDLTIGQNYEGTANGYRLQLLTNEGGTVNHIHVGIRWEGATSSTSYGASTPSAPSTGATTGGTAQAPSSGSKERRPSRRRHKRQRKRPKVRLSPLPAALDPADYGVDTTYTEPTKRAPIRIEV